MLHARRSRVPVGPLDPAEGVGPVAGWRHAAVLLTVVASFVAFVVGVLEYHWDFDQLSAVFFLMGVAAGLFGGLRIGGTADAFVDGLRSMAYAALADRIRQGDLRRAE